MLTKLGLRPAKEMLPFDMVRCTFDGLVELTAKGFFSSSAAPESQKLLGHSSNITSPPYVFPRESLDGFFPIPQSINDGSDGAAAALNFTPDPVSVWLLFRSQHACFTHFNLSRADVQAEFRRRMREWDALLHPTHPSSAISGGVTFLRTAIAENPADEIEMLPQFHSAVRHRTRGRLPFRTVFVVHDQAPATQPLCSFPQESSEHQSPCIVWNIKRQVAPSASVAGDAEPSLLDMCHDGYQTILTTMCKEQKWRSLDASLPSYAAYMKSRGVPFAPYTELSRVAGVPAVRGTCTGFGSTFSAALGRCMHCGCTDGHAVAPGQFDTQRPWTEVDTDELLVNYALHDGDEVAAVEATALKQKRGAHETWQQLQLLIPRFFSD